MKEHVSLTFLSKGYSLGDRGRIRALCISGGAQWALRDPALCVSFRVVT